MNNDLRICLVTFATSKECLTDSFFELHEYINNIYKCNAVAFVDILDDSRDLFSVRQFCSPFKTKYSRIQSLFHLIDADYFIFVDNDITPDCKNIELLLNESISLEADLSWGKISVSSEINLIEKTIGLDKFISHSIIRPFLWRLEIGASIPGQVFILKKSSFNEILPEDDTLFDDLTIGVCARNKNLVTHFTSSTLGWEKPKKSLFELISQRKRWAKGYSQVLLENIKNCTTLKLVLVHGFFYHFALIALLLLLPLFIPLGFIWSFLIVFLSIASVLSFFSSYSFMVSTAYVIIFFFAHVVWSFFFIFNFLFILLDRECFKKL